MADMSMDEFYQNMPIGSIDKAIGNNIYGFNHRQIPGMVPMNKDVYGYTFFVRPQLNLGPVNLRQFRPFRALLSQNPLSLQRFVRCTLDPRLSYGVEGNTEITTPLVDPEQAFIPIMTNNLTSVSGWPDITSPTFTSKSGVYNEVYSQVDGIVRNFESFDIDVSWRNTRGDPIVYLLYTWLNYQSLVFENVLMPYIDYLKMNRLDYNTRIYRFVMDETKKYIKKVASTGASFPISLPIGSFMDFNNERVYNDQNKDITVRFRCLGVDYFDPISFQDFNRTVMIFNPAMRQVKNLTRTNNDDILVAGDVVKIPQDLLTYFNHRGYPWVNMDTYELEWWIPTSFYDAKIGTVFTTPRKEVGRDIPGQSDIDVNEDDIYVGD